MQTRRDEVLLATKTLSRSYDGAMSDLDKSLKNLQTDKIDLWQMHSISVNEDLEAIFSDDGCLKAFEEAREQGIVRFLGIIGMKIPARGRIFENDGILTMKEAMGYTLSLPVSTIIIGIREVAELEKNIQIAKEFAQLSADEMLAIEKKAEPYYREFMFFKRLVA